MTQWSKYEAEVSHYFQHEPGKASVNLNPSGGYGSEPAPPRWPAMKVEVGGRTMTIPANHWTMITVLERLRAADRIMPFRGPTYRQGECIALGAPSCSMVLRAAYGVLACKYDDSAPDGAVFLRQAKMAYEQAAEQVPSVRGPSPKERIMRRWARVFGE